MKRRCGLTVLAWLGLGCCAGLPAQDQSLRYRWEKGIYRFDYRKTVSRTRLDGERSGRPQTMSVSGVLIVDLDSADQAAGTATGTLRLENARVLLPPVRKVDPERAVMVEETGSRDLLAALAQEVLHELRCKVLLNSQGVLTVQQRTPAELAGVLQRTVAYRALSKDVIQGLLTQLEEHLGWRPGALDDDLLALGADQPGRPAPSGLALLHPAKQLVAAAARESGRTEVSWRRVARPGADKPQPFAQARKAGREPPITISLERIVASEQAHGRALLDANLGLPDRLDEKYVAVLALACGDQKQQHQVEVEYQLRRLAPAVREPSPAGKDGP